MTDFPVPDESTLRKIALFFNMQHEIRAGRRGADRAANSAVLDDIGLNNWLDRVNKAGGVANTLYTEKRR